MRRIRSGRGGGRCGGRRLASADTSASVGIAALSALGALGAAASGALVGDVLTIARAIDVDPQRVHGEAVEDGGGEGGIAEVTPPVAERDIGAHGGRGATVPTIDQIVEGVGGRGLVTVFLDL